jgi:hypothetical protein
LESSTWENKKLTTSTDAIHVIDTMDVRRYRKVDCDSDQFFVQIKFKLKSRVIWKEIRPEDQKIYHKTYTRISLKYREEIKLLEKKPVLLKPE